MEQELKKLIAEKFKTAPKALEPVTPKTHIIYSHYSKDEVVSLKFKMVNEQLDGLMTWIARRFLFVVKEQNHKFNFQEIDDIRQDMKLALWDIVNQYWDRPEGELLKVGKTVLWRWVSYHIRMAHLKKNSGVMVLLSHFENPDDVLDNWAWKHRAPNNGWIEQNDLAYLKDEFYAYLQVHTHNNMEVHIFKLVAFPEQEPEFIKFCDELLAKKKRRSRSTVTQSSIAKYLGVNHCSVYNCLKHLQQSYTKFQEECNAFRRPRKRTS